MAEEIKPEEQESQADKQNQKKKKQQEKAKHWAREWFDALVFAAVAALIIRTFFFEAYRIPTPSMEKTLLTGDFLVVSKVSYGPRTPMVLGIPFTEVYLHGVTLPWTRLPGVSEIQRYDIAVFNYPIDIAPIAAKTNYIKRVMGIPGDTLFVRQKLVHVNGELAKQFPSVQMHYAVQVRERVRLSPSKVKAAGGTLSGALGPNVYLVNMTSEVAQEISEWSEVVSLGPHVLPTTFKEYSRTDFNFASGFVNHDHMPMVVVPFEGQDVSLTPDNWHIYENIITRYERNNVEQNGDQFIINGDTTNTYTIKKDYYFMMGDNRDDSQDSRYWGFVPDDHIVGKAGMIYFSWNSERWLPRFDRMFNFVHQ